MIVKAVRYIVRHCSQHKALREILGSYHHSLQARRSAVETHGRLVRTHGKLVRTHGRLVKAHTWRELIIKDDSISFQLINCTFNLKSLARAYVRPRGDIFQILEGLTNHLRQHEGGPWAAMGCKSATASVLSEMLQKLAAAEDSIVN